MGGFGGGPPMGGYPPGGGGFGPPMPPPPGPQKSGLFGAQIAIIVIVAVVVLFGGCVGVSCCVMSRRATHTSSSPSPSPEPPRKSPTPSQSNDDWITAQRPYVKFHPPAGWSTEITNDKEWGIFRSPTRDAVFAFTTFNQPGESTRRLSRAESVLGVSNVDWRTPRFGTVGKDKFNARVGDGTCNFKGPNGYIWYATVDAGSSDQILLIFTVSASAPQSRRAEAQAAVDSLQRR